MSGTTTHYYGQALTGHGMKHVYNDIMNEADKVYLLKGISGFKISKLLKKLSSFYSDKGADIDFFYDPLFNDTLQAVLVKAPYHILFLQGSNPSIEPLLPGSRDHVISLYDCVDEKKLSQSEKELTELVKSKDTYYKACFVAMANAVKIHDDWEVETRRHMNWSGLDVQFDELKKQLFGERKLEKTPRFTHRILGTLTPAGARDTVPSITQNLERRLFIKGYPGTGKSSMIKKLANEAIQRGYDVQMIWCGLDSNSVDMVILPELKFCIFDSTEPHVYFPEENRPGDEIFDIAQHCHPTEVELSNIDRIVAKYKAAISEGTAYAKLYAEEERKIRELIDDAVHEDRFEEKVSVLFK